MYLPISPLPTCYLCSVANYNTSCLLRAHIHNLTLPLSQESEHGLSEVSVQVLKAGNQGVSQVALSSAGKLWKNL